MNETKEEQLFNDIENIKNNKNKNNTAEAKRRLSSNLDIVFDNDYLSQELAGLDVDSLYSIIADAHPNQEKCYVFFEKLISNNVTNAHLLLDLIDIKSLNVKLWPKFAFEKCKGNEFWTLFSGNKEKIMKGKYFIIAFIMLLMLMNLLMTYLLISIKMKQCICPDDKCSQAKDQFRNNENQKDEKTGNNPDIKKMVQKFNELKEKVDKLAYLMSKKPITNSNSNKNNNKNSWITFSRNDAYVEESQESPDFELVNDKINKTEVLLSYLYPEKFENKSPFDMVQTFQQNGVLSSLYNENKVKLSISSNDISRILNPSNEDPLQTNSISKYTLFFYFDQLNENANNNNDNKNNINSKKKDNKVLSFVKNQIQSINKIKNNILHSPKVIECVEITTADDGFPSFVGIYDENDYVLTEQKNNQEFNGQNKKVTIKLNATLSSLKIVLSGISLDGRKYTKIKSIVFVCSSFPGTKLINKQTCNDIRIISREHNLTHVVNINNLEVIRTGIENNPYFDIEFTNGQFVPTGLSIKTGKKPLLPFQLLALEGGSWLNGKSSISLFENKVMQSGDYRHLFQFDVKTRRPYKKFRIMQIKEESALEFTYFDMYGFYIDDKLKK